MILKTNLREEEKYDLRKVSLHVIGVISLY